LATGLILSAATGCLTGSVNNNSSSGIASAQGAGNPVTPTMATVLSESTTGAGKEITAFCYVSSGGTLRLPSAATVVQTIPAVNAISQGSNMATLSANTVGTYRVYCHMADDSIADLDGAPLTVGPAAPYNWVVNLLDRQCYSQQVGLPLDYLIYDTFGNRITNATVTLQTVPTVPVTMDNLGRFQISQEGKYDITLEVRTPLAPGSTITPYANTIVVDSTPPTITLSSPVRGAMLQSGTLADSAVNVIGTALDLASAITSLSINGTTVPVATGSKSASINLTQTSRWGLNIITGTSQDACGNVAALSQSYLRSPTYFSTTLGPDTKAQVGAGVVAQLNQSAVDNGNPSSANDLRSLVNNALATLNLNTMFAPGQTLATQPLSPACPLNGSLCMLEMTTANTIGYGVYRDPNANNKVTFAPPIIDSVDIVNGGVQLAAHMGAVSLPLVVQAADVECALGCPTMHGWYDLNASVGFSSATLSATVGASYSSGQAQVTLANVNLALSGLYLNVDCGVVSGLCNAITGLVTSMLSGTVQSMVTSTLQSTVAPAVGSALNGVSLATCIAAPSPLNLELNVDASLDSVAFCGPEVGLGRPSICPASVTSGYGLLTAATQFYPTSRDPNIASTTLGAIRDGGALPTINSTTVGLGAAIKDDAVNQLLWALWYGGALDTDVTSMLGSILPAGADIKIKAALPPVVMPGRNNDQIDVGVGDLYIDATLDLSALLGNGAAPLLFHAAGYLSLILGGSMEIDANTNTLLVNIDPKADSGVQITQVDDSASGYQGAISNFLDLVLSQNLPGVLQKAIGTMPLPAIRVGGLPGIASGTYWGLSKLGISRSPDYTVLTGSLVSGVGSSSSSWPWLSACTHSGTAK